MEMRTATIPVPATLLRGVRRPRVALVGRHRTGKSTIFEAASSPAVRHERLAGRGGAYQECVVEVGLEQISLVDLPSISSLQTLDEHDQIVLKYLLWGDHWPTIARGEDDQPATSFVAPDVLIQVVDATSLERDLELTLELSQLGRPLVIALNFADEARHKGLFINIRLLSERLGVPVVPTVAYMGKGMSALFEAVLKAARERLCPLPQQPSPHITESLRSLSRILARPELEQELRVPRPLLLTQLAQADSPFAREVGSRFPALVPELELARDAAAAVLPRPLSEELHADRHHCVALLYEAVTSMRGPERGAGWRVWLDEIFLHPRWGLVGTLAVFAAILFLVFEISAVLDGLTSARLATWLQLWQPETTYGVIVRAVADALVGLLGIVLPYMIPLVILLVSLEESGIMHRVAFVVDRGFHRIGLHGDVAVPFLIGLGCNVPAISAVSTTVSGRERVAAALLITFVPCSARSAIILALGGKYLGGLGVFAIFALTMLVIGLLGRFLAAHYADSAPGLVQEIPPYRMPHWRAILNSTWERTSDIITIVTPLLVAGSIFLALLAYFGADRVINWMLVPVTDWWLGLPAVLGVPILFGILRKELSLLMIFQALGTQVISPQLSWVQIFTFLIFLTFYIPCLSTLAVMLKTLGRREALSSAALSIAVALIVAGGARLAASGVSLFVG